MGSDANTQSAEAAAEEEPISLAPLACRRLALVVHPSSIGTTTMPLPLELDNSSIAGAMASEFIDAAAVGSVDADASHQLARLLFAVGFFTMLLDLAAALYKAPSGVVYKSHKLAYYLTLAAIFTFAVAEVITAFCLPRYGSSSERVRTLARIVLFISVLPLVGVIALGGFAVVVRS